MCFSDGNLFWSSIIISKLSAFVNKKVKAFVMFNRQNVIRVLQKGIFREQQYSSNILKELRSENQIPLPMEVTMLKCVFHQKLSQSINFEFTIV